ncbi:type II toxin-antitoxin system VapC family toxin [Planctomycetota bacterium]
MNQRGKDAALHAVALMQQATVIDVTSSIAMTAATLSLELKLPMADSLILTTAREHNAILWTQDADFQGIPDVKYITK